MTPETAALRGRLDRLDATFTGRAAITIETATVRALCDAADEVKRLRRRLADTQAILDGAGVEVANLRVASGLLYTRAEEAEAEVERLRTWLDAAGSARKQVDTLLGRAKAERNASRTAHADALALLRAVVSYDDANQSDLPLPLLDRLRAAIGGQS